MLADVYQPALSKAIHESLGKVIVENMPPITENLEIDGVLCISLSKKNDKQIVVKIHDTIEPRKSARNEPGSGRSSPWQIPLEKIQAAQQRFLSFNGTDDDIPSPGSCNDAPVDLRGPRLTPTNEDDDNSAAFKYTNGATDSPMTNASDSGSESGKVFANSQSIPMSGNIPLNSKEMRTLKKDGATQKKAPNEMRCRICSQMCVGGLPALQSHTQEAHKRYVCRFCYNTFSLRCNLKRHERLHVGAKPYNCKMCSKSFTRSTDLKLHMHKHGMSGDDVVVPCPQCPRTFLSVQNLRWHLYKVHKETEATFACTICEKLFMDKDEYMKHREDHTNNLIQNRPPSSAATSDSHDNELDLESLSFDDSDSENQLMIDTQSEGTMEFDDDVSNVLNLQNRDDTSNCSTHGSVSLELVNGLPSKDSVKIAFKSPVTVPRSNNRTDDTATPTPSPSSTSSRSGSRKRKIKNPTKIIEIIEEPEDDIDIDNLYYNSPAAKALRAEKNSSQNGGAGSNVLLRAGDLSLLFQDEPENLVTKPRVSTPGPTSNSSSKGYSIASNTLSQIAYSVKNNVLPTLTSPMNNSSVTATPTQVLDLRNILSPYQNQVGQPRVAGPQAFPTVTPILITPDRTYSPQSEVKKSGGKPKTGNIPHSVTPVNKSKIENITEAMDENKEFQCVEMGCNETYLGFSAYEDHCMIRHGRYPCKFCKQTFSGKNNRTRHMRCHLGAKTYTCPDCNKNFSRPDSMREHQFIHTLSYQEDKCRNCGAAFDKKNLLLAHLKQCYRHKMETGKSTKFIDETPQYLGATTSGAKHKTDSDALAPLKPIKFTLNNIPAFKHIDPTLENAKVPSASSKLFGSVYSMADVRSSPTLAMNTFSTSLVASRKNVASPLNLSGGSLTTARNTASPLTIPTVVNSSAFPSPLVIVPTSTTSSNAHVPAGLLAASIANSISHNPPSPLLIAPAGVAPLVIQPESLAQPGDVANFSTKSASSILATSLMTNCANLTDVTPSVTPKSTPSRAESPANESSQPANSAPSGARVLDAVKKLVNKRNGEEGKDQNANTKNKELETEGE